MTPYEDLHREWLEHPVTQKLLKMLEYEQKNISDAWINGEFTHESMDGTAQLMFGAMNHARGLGAAYQMITEGDFLQEEEE